MTANNELRELRFMLDRLDCLHEQRGETLTAGTTPRSRRCTTSGTTRPTGSPGSWAPIWLTTSRGSFVGRTE